MSETELREVYNIFADAWRLYKKYCEPVGDDSFWNALAEESRSIARKYNNSRLSVALMSTVLTEIEQIYLNL